MQKLIDFWKELELDQKPYIHPKDKMHLANLYYSYNGFTKYYEETYWTDKSIFHTDLLPVPYAGDLNNAKIFLLLLNPGLSFITYHAEESSSKFRDALKDTIKQQFQNQLFPFVYLNPDFLWTGGGQYWLGRFKDYIAQIKIDRSCTYIEATKFLSQRIAVLELMPYHSSNFTKHNLLNKLESVNQMKQFVERFVMPKVHSDQACIICTRQSRVWNLKVHKNILIYSKSQTRGAHISKKTSAFNLINEFLND